MKKRIFAALTALILAVSALTFTACSEPTPKELFSESLINAFNSEENSFISNMLNTEQKDTKSTLKLEIDKLAAQGNDLTSFGKIALEGTVLADFDSKLQKTDLSFSFMNENPTMSAVTDLNTGKLFYTDLLGVNKKPILIEDGQQNPSGDVDLSDVSIDPEAITQVIDSLTAVIEKNITETAYTAEEKTVTVDGKTFEGATVVTLNITNEMAKTIGKEFTDALLANEAIKSMMGDDFKFEEGDVPKSVKFTNTVVDEKSIALDVAIELPDKEKDESEDDSEDIFEGEFEFNKGPEYSNFSIHATYIDGNFKLDLGPVDANGKYFEEHGFMTVTYTLEGENEKFLFSLTDDGETREFLKIEGTYKDNKHEGTATIGADPNGVSLKYSLTLGETTADLSVGPMTVTNMGQKQEIDLLITANADMTDKNNVKLNGSVKLNVPGGLDVSAKYSMTSTVEDVTVQSVTDYETIDQVDMNKLQSDLAKKYPNLYRMFASSFMGNTDEF